MADPVTVPVDVLLGFNALDDTVFIPGAQIPFTVKVTLMVRLAWEASGPISVQVSVGAI